MEKRILQSIILVGALVPILGGGVGVLKGSAALGPWTSASADSQVRYLSGLLLAIGLSYCACVPAVERRGREIRLLSALVVVGGLSRLAGVVVVGNPGAMGWTLVMELLVAPLICLWQARLEARARGAIAQR